MALVETELALYSMSQFSLTGVPCSKLAEPPIVYKLQVVHESRLLLNILKLNCMQIISVTLSNLQCHVCCSVCHKKSTSLQMLLLHVRSWGNVM